MALSEIKAVELLQFLLLALSSRRYFLRVVQCIQLTIMDSLSGTDVIQTESLKNLNFMVIFELLPIDKE